MMFGQGRGLSVIKKAPSPLLLKLTWPVASSFEPYPPKEKPLISTNIFLQPLTLQVHLQTEQHSMQSMLTVVMRAITTCCRHKFAMLMRSSNVLVWQDDA